MLTEVTDLNSISMRFKVELLYKHGRTTHVFYAKHLEELSNKIENRYPNSKIISIVGGGH